MLVLSPLARGKLGRLVTERSKEGLVPAHAGKTSSFSWLLRRSAAYPRSRGENDVHAEASIRFEGSSPLTRGKLACFGRADAFPGLIPTHAGKTELPRSAGSHHWAHPRSCGENLPASWSMEVPPGSSPLMRGKLALLGVVLHSVGLIPAHAGNTKTRALSPGLRAAHPRSCGENFFRMIASYLLTGSSPLMQGKPNRGVPGHPRARLIPTHAGKTWCASARPQRSRAHPRSCGENAVMARTVRSSMGSSPLTRGKPEHAGRNLRRRGLIPAHAGKTRRPSRCRSTRWAHPRSCGENQAAFTALRNVSGSSPLMRGKHGQRRKGLPRGRLIPAHAGKTGSPQPRRCRARAHPRSHGENLRAIRRVSM